MEYSVNDIAKEVDVTIQAVYRRIKLIEDEDNLYFTKGSKGETVITEKGREILLDRFKNKLEEKKMIDEQIMNNSFYATILAENERLKEELKEKANEIEFHKQESSSSKNEMIKEREHSRELSNELMTLARQLAELNRNNQVLLLNTQKENDSIEGEKTEPEEKISFWKRRIFGNGKPRT